MIRADHPKSIFTILSNILFIFNYTFITRITSVYIMCTNGLLLKILVNNRSLSSLLN